MSAGFVTPLAIASLVTVIALLLQPRLKPDVAARSLVVAAVAVAASVTWALLTLVLGLLAESAWVERWSWWCSQLYRSDPHVRVWVGAVAVALMTFATVRVFRAIMDARRVHRRLPTCDGGVLIIESDQPAAYAVPGRRGGVVISRGMIDALEPREQEVMWAHERSHLRHRHHWYLVAAEMAVAVVPPMRHLADQVRFATERWADEDAVVAVHGDRELVARAIARAALATSDHQPAAMALAGTGVRARVRAMVDVEQRSLATSTGLGLGTVVATTSIVGSGIQLHHLVALLQHLCLGS